MDITSEEISRVELLADKFSNPDDINFDFLIIDDTISNKSFIGSNYNKYGKFFRSPGTDRLFPAEGENETKINDEFIEIEKELNNIFNIYSKSYYPDPITSVYISHNQNEKLYYFIIHSIIKELDIEYIWKTIHQVTVHDSNIGILSCINLNISQNKHISDDSEIANPDIVPENIPDKSDNNCQSKIQLIVEKSASRVSQTKEANNDIIAKDSNGQSIDRSCPSGKSGDELEMTHKSSTVDREKSRNSSMCSNGKEMTRNTIGLSNDIDNNLDGNRTISDTIERNNSNCSHTDESTTITDNDNNESIFHKNCISGRCSKNNDNNNEDANESKNEIDKPNCTINLSRASSIDLPFKLNQKITNHSFNITMSKEDRIQNDTTKEFIHLVGPIIEQNENSLRNTIEDMVILKPQYILKKLCERPMIRSHIFGLRK